jgi:hypothetical protein
MLLSLKNMGFRNRSGKDIETVCIVASCYVRKSNYSKSRCAGRYCKGNAKRINAELDELRAISTSGKEFLEGIEKRVTTDGISSLKISLIMSLGII